MHWLWIDRVVELVPRQRIVTLKNVSIAEDHLHDHFAPDPVRRLAAAPLMPASLIVEGMAQSAGILVGQAGDFREKVVLGKVNRVELDADVPPGFTLRYTATLLQFDRAGASTGGLVELLDPARPSEPPQEIGRVDLMFSHIDQNMTGLEFPERNFVFTESFRTLLRSSGIEPTF